MVTHKMLAVAMVVTLTGALGGCTSTKGAPATATASMRGLEVARRHCAACHAVEPAGGTSPRDRAPSFASVEMRHTAALEDRVENLTRRGHYGMPPVPLRDDQVLDVVAYIAGLDRR